MNLNQIWPDWEIVEKIGSGSYGSVYCIKRTDRGSSFYAALKIITVPKEPAEVEHLRSSGMDEISITKYFQDYADRMYREIELMETLKGNTNIVSYEDHKLVEHPDGFGYDIYIRMQLLTPLLQYQKSHKLTTKDVVRLGCDLCNALELCEKRRIIHRDIKPENIFVSENGDFEIGDFGISRTANATTYGTVAGTFFYMAPEVYRNQAYNATVDLYSLGLVLYQYLNNGRLPFLPDAPAPLRFGDNESANNQRLQGQPLPALKGVSARLSNVVLKACAYEPKDRYQTAAELRAALEACIATERMSQRNQTGGQSISQSSKARLLKKRKKERILWPEFLMCVLSIITLMLCMGGKGYFRDDSLLFSCALIGIGLVSSVVLICRRFACAEQLDDSIYTVVDELVAIALLLPYTTVGCMTFYRAVDYGLVRTIDNFPPFVLVPIILSSIFIVIDQIPEDEKLFKFALLAASLMGALYHRVIDTAIYLSAVLMVTQALKSVTRNCNWQKYLSITALFVLFIMIAGT